MDMEAIILANTAKRIFVGNRPNKSQEVSFAEHHITFFDPVETVLQHSTLFWDVT